MHSYHQAPHFENVSAPMQPVSGDETILTVLRHTHAYIGMAIFS